MGNKYHSLFYQSPLSRIQQSRFLIFSISARFQGKFSLFLSVSLTVVLGVESTKQNELYVLNETESSCLRSEGKRDQWQRGGNHSCTLLFTVSCTYHHLWMLL
ncbi:hypothetical protein K2173_016113 [Erythroxylum novogranatense]|uniref:Uncharacterized protein n=1 Tax=Erythroxylum novogranatense TaxID=1862640 RepID=A0AAV8SFH1_9ROSI|nr:hypothetical protein K2173_016113 [Erythroxylum novogranatense]